MDLPAVYLESDFENTAERDLLLHLQCIMQIGDGMYATATRSSISGRLIPDGAYEQLIHAVARRYGREIVPTPELLAYNSRRSTRIPTCRYNEMSARR